MKINKIILIVLFASMSFCAKGHVFADPALVSLIDTALVHNADLKTALLNVNQAEASLRSARLAFLPSVSIGGEASVQKAGNSAVATTYNIPLSMQWEIDLAGRIRGEKKLKEASYLGTEETAKAVKIEVISAVANSYYTILMMNEQLSITRESIDIARKTVETMEEMMKVGMVNELAVGQSKTTLLSLLASENALLQQIAVAENALSVIVGQRLENDIQGSLGETSLPIDFNREYPLSCLSERPDVRAAEYSLAAETAGVGIARSAFYPSLNISASAGWTNNIGQIVNPWQMLLNAVASLAQPLFNKGTNKTDLAIAEARQEQALVAFEKALLTAGTELSDALVSCSMSSDRIKIRISEVEVAENAFEVCQYLFTNSSATSLEVLTAQNSLLQSRLSLLSDRMDLIQGQINLFKALGGNTAM